MEKRNSKSTDGKSGSDTTLIFNRSDFSNEIQKYHKKQGLKIKLNLGGIHKRSDTGIYRFRSRRKDLRYDRSLHTRDYNEAIIRSKIVMKDLILRALGE